MLHVLPTSPSIPEEPRIWTWKANGPVDVTRDGSDVVVKINGTYRDAKGTLVYRVTPAGRLDVSYNFEYIASEVNVREIGLRFGVPLSMDTLQWKRRGEWSSYPADHIGRNEGRARAHSSAAPDNPSTRPYSQDDSPMGTNDFRSTKRHIENASIMNADGGYGLYIDSNGDQNLRAAVETDQIAVYVNDWFGGTAATASEWQTNYGKGKLLKTGEQFQGTIRLWIVSQQTKSDRVHRAEGIAPRECEHGISGGHSAGHKNLVQSRQPRIGTAPDIGATSFQ
jgi:beta-galactosidase